MDLLLTHGRRCKYGGEEGHEGRVGRPRARPGRGARAELGMTAVGGSAVGWIWAETGPSVSDA